jgi:hypothetical protein
MFNKHLHLSKGLTILFILVSLYMAFYSQIKQTILFEISKLNTDNEGGDIRALFEWKKLIDPATGALPKGIKSKELVFAAQFLQNKSTKSTGNWNQRGPTNVGGRTRAFAIDIDNDQIILAGQVTGGLWRSTNGGASWVRITPRNQMPSITCIVQDIRPGHHQTWYYGTGEALGNSAYAPGAFYVGDGAFKSIDNGLTWQPLTGTAIGNPQNFTTNWQLMYGFAIDQSELNNDELYASTYDGIYKSIDGGVTWTNPLHGNASSSYSTDVAVNNTGVVYAALSSDGAAKGIWRSVDGTSFVNILPANFPSNYRRIKICINPHNQNEVYFLISNTDTVGLQTINVWGTKEWNCLFKYTYLTADGAGTNGTWTNLSQNLPSGSTALFDNWHTQGGYDLQMKFHPTNPNTIFIAGTNAYRSTDGFTSNNNTTQIGGYAKGTQLIGFQVYANHHPDIHDLVFNPNSPNELYTACDGGIFKTSNCNADTVVWASLNNGYLNTQVYTVVGSPNAGSNILLGGFQDNGIYFTQNTNLNTSWKMPFNGDGSFMAIDSATHVYYLSIQLGKTIKAILDNNGQITQFARIDPIGPQRDDYEFINPFILDPTDNNIMYMPAGRNIYRNSNLAGIPFAGNYDSISTNWTRFSDTTTTNITALACSKVLPAHTLVYGTEGKKLYKIANAHTGNPTRTDITGTNFPLANINCIYIDPDNADNMVVVFSNYNVYSLFATNNGGFNWVKVAGNIEQNLNGGGNGPSLRWISKMKINAQDKYFLATSIGLFSADSLVEHTTTNAGTVWTQEGQNEIGNTLVDHIFTRNADNFIAIATHGSAIYSTNYGWTTGTNNYPKMANASLSLFPNPTNNILNVSWSNIQPKYLSILNAQGITKYKSNIASSSINNLKVNIDFLTPGVYYALVQNYDNTNTVQKFIKIK